MIYRIILPLMFAVVVSLLVSQRLQPFRDDGIPWDTARGQRGAVEHMDTMS